MMARTSRTRGDRTKNLVGFVVGRVFYAVDILRAKEILNPLPIVELPHAPPAIVGVADHRGLVVPVLDLRRRFSLPEAEATRKTKWIIVGVQKRSIALVVDAVTDVFGALDSDQRGIPALGAGDRERGIAAVYKHEGHLTFVLDIDRVAAPAENLDLSLVQRLADGASV
jgi:purine-binding chemotaxis protein CheW